MKTIDEDIKSGQFKKDISALRRRGVPEKTVQRQAEKSVGAAG